MVLENGDALAAVTARTRIRAPTGTDVLIRGVSEAVRTAMRALTNTSLSPTGGPAADGTALTITGSGFASGATVSVGGVAYLPVVVVSPTAITCTTAQHAAGAVSIVVTNPDSQAAMATGVFTYVAAPTVTSPTTARLTSRITCRGSICTTTGSVPKDATRLTQTARRVAAASSLFTEMATGVRRGTCTITKGNDQRRSYRCTITLTTGRWSLTITAFAKATARASATRQVTVAPRTRA